MAKYNVQVEDSEGNQYYPKPDLLTTKEQVSANTAAGKSVDALVVKQISSDISKVRTYVGSDGKLHFVNSAGADSVLPFSCAQVIYETIGRTDTKKYVFEHVKHGYVAFIGKTSYNNKAISFSNNVQYEQLRYYTAKDTLRVSATIFEITITDNNPITIQIAAADSNTTSAECAVLIVCD